MRTVSPPVSEIACAVPCGPHHVYILPTHDRSRAKIGRTRNGTPLDRIAALSCTYPEIDLSRAAIVEVDTHKIEKVVHIAFGPRSDRQPCRRDGFSEWFSGDIVDEALSFLETVAARRGTEYRVTRNIDALIQEHRARNPQIGVRAARPTGAELDQRTAFVEDALRDSVLGRARDVIDRLGERPFDSVVTHGSRRYLCRTVQRTVEPDCWLADDRYRVSDWGQSLVALADVVLSVDGGNGRWRFLDLPAFVPFDSDHGREYYRIPESADYTSGSDKSDPLLDRAAWLVLEQAIAHLPVVASPCDPTVSGGATVRDAH